MLDTNQYLDIKNRLILSSGNDCIGVQISKSITLYFDYHFSLLKFNLLTQFHSGLVRLILEGINHVLFSNVSLYAYVQYILRAKSFPMLFI